MASDIDLHDDLFVDPSDPLDKEASLAELRGRHRLGAVQWFAVAAALLLMLGIGIWAKTDADNKADALEHRAQILAAANSKQDAKIDSLQGSTSQLAQDSIALRKELEKKGVNPNTIAPPPEVRLVGPAGQDGRGLTGATVSNGNLVLFYSDGSSQLVGNVRGPAGVGITAASVDEGKLTLDFSDGTSSNLGTVVGPVGATGPPGPQGIQGLPGIEGDVGPKGEPGRGITSVDCVSDDTSNGSHWVIHYTAGDDTEAEGPCKVSILP